MTKAATLYYQPSTLFMLPLGVKLLLDKAEKENLTLHALEVIWSVKNKRWELLATFEEKT